MTRPTLYPAILIMLGFGVVIGLINGLVVSYLRVPSFIATLGMMLLVRGGALYWVGGAPQRLPDRQLARFWPELH